MNIKPAKPLRERVHIIPLGHEYDRAISPFETRKADRAYLMAVPGSMELDPEMLRRQDHFTQKVLARLEFLGIDSEPLEVNLFDVCETLKAISAIIVNEKSKGNEILINISSCGRKTSFAATMAAMVHEVDCYYVSASGYITDDTSGDYLDHGISIVGDFQRPPEVLHRFKIMMPKEESQLILAELYRTDSRSMTLNAIIDFLHSKGIHGYETLPEISGKTGEFKAGKKLRELLNKTNRRYLVELEKNHYVSREKVGRMHHLHLTTDGEIIACVSGLL